MSFEYDDHVAVREAGAGRWAADLTDGWRVGGGLNGGYLLAVVGNALRGQFPATPDVISVSAHYVSASRAGVAEVATRLVRESGNFTTASAELIQEGQVRLTALATLGDLSAEPELVATTAKPPAIADRAECVGASAAPEDFRRIAPLLDRFELLLDPACVGWALGAPSGVGAMQGWFRLTGGREPDPVSLLTVADALPPVTFDLGRGGWAPTVSLAVHVRALPAPGWLRVRHATRNVAGSMFEEDCEVWDSADRLVVQSRQLALLPRD